MWILERGGHLETRAGCTRFIALINGRYIKENYSYYGLIHNRCQHTQSDPSSSIWQITLKEAEYILTYKPDGTFLVRERKGKPVNDPSSSSISTHVIGVV